MKRSVMYNIIGVVFLVLLTVGTTNTTIGAVPATDPSPPVESTRRVPRPVILYRDPTPSDFRIPPPAIYLQKSRMSTQSATIHVNYIPGGEMSVYGDLCVTWPTEAFTTC